MNRLIEEARSYLNEENDTNDIGKYLGNVKYVINKDGTIDVDGDVKLRLVNDNVTKIPFKFGKVTGNFDCSYSELTSLEGAPKEVSGSFDCSSNKLTSLKGAPKEVGKSFYCNYNELTSLEGIPDKVGYSFGCMSNYLTSLKGIPEIVTGDFDCGYNELTSLEGAPKEVGRTFNCDSNKLTSLEGAPLSFQSFSCYNNKLTSLKGVPKTVRGYFVCSYNQLTSLEGSPVTVRGDYNCSHNKLTSLEGSPKKIGNNFDCSHNKLTSLEGAPDKVDGYFDCRSNKKHFTKEDVVQVSDVNLKNVVTGYSKKTGVKIIYNLKEIEDNDDSVILWNSITNVLDTYIDEEEWEETNMKDTVKLTIKAESQSEADLIVKGLDDVIPKELIISKKIN